MFNEINNEVTIVSLDKMIYHAIYEICYRLSKHPDEEIIFSFVKEFLDGNEIAESTFWDRLKTLEIDGKLLINHQRRGSFSFGRNVIRMPVLILVLYPTISSLAAPYHALKI